MKLFVGLGNPGTKYEKTRHNIGFLAIDAIAEGHGFSAWRSKFQGELAEGKLGIEKVFLLKPQTFMNLSGQSVGEAARFFKIKPQDIYVFHDELDLAPGKMRVKTGGGHAGHNGLRSCHEHLGADYHRVRIGIGHPGDKRLVSAYVLHDFAKADWNWIDPMLQGIADGAPALANSDPSGFMNAVALRVKPPKPKAGSKTEPAPHLEALKNTKPSAPQLEEDNPPRSPLARLLDHFNTRE